MSKKIAMVFPYAPLYREPIYLLMDKTFDIDWYFCADADHSLKKMDYSKLKSVNTSLKERLFKGHSFWYKGLTSLPLRKYDYLIIAGQTHCLAEWYLALRYGNKNNGQKVFFWTHGWYGKETGIQKWLKRIYYHFADGMFLYGDRAKTLMVKEGFNGDKLYPIHNSLDYDKQKCIREGIVNTAIYDRHFGNHHPVLLFIGRLTKVKQLDLLIDSLYILSKQTIYFNLVFVGDGVMRQVLEDKVKAYSLQQYVWFYGPSFDEHANAELIYNADLTVAPGNIGLTAMHSLVYGTPCLTHNCYERQMPEFEAVKDGETGCFFEYQNAESLANAILRWFSENGSKREDVRKSCMRMIDELWNPYFQMNVLKNQLK